MVVAEEAAEESRDSSTDSLESMSSIVTMVDMADSMVTTVEVEAASMVSSLEVEANTTVPAVFSLTGGRVPLSMVPRHCISSSLQPSSFVVSSPRDPSSIVDLYCDDEFQRSLEYQPNMLLYPVEGLTSLEGEFGRMDEGNSLNQSCHNSCLLQGPSSRCR